MARLRKSNRNEVSSRATATEAPKLQQTAPFIKKDREKTLARKTILPDRDFLFIPQPSADGIKPSITLIFLLWLDFLVRMREAHAREASYLTSESDITNAFNWLPYNALILNNDQINIQQIKRNNRGYEDYIETYMSWMDRTTQQVKKEILLHLDNYRALLREEIKKYCVLAPELSESLAQLVPEEIDIFAHLVMVSGTLDKDIDLRGQISENFARNFRRGYETDRIHGCSIKALGEDNSFKIMYDGLHLSGMLGPKSNLLLREFVDLDWNNLTNTWTENTFVANRSKLELICGHKVVVDEESTGIEITDPKHVIGDVILPSKHREKISSLCKHYKKHKLGRDNMKLAFLFKGEPGTGKTMTAHAIGHMLNMRVLKVYFAKVPAESEKIISYLITMSKIKNAVLLFEECENLLVSNWMTGEHNSSMKSMFERFNHVAVFNTNHPGHLGAIERRMTYTVNFKKQTADIRKIILGKEIEKAAISYGIKALPDKAFLDKMAEKYNINGGHYDQVLQLASAQSDDNELSDSAVEDAFESHMSMQENAQGDDVRDPKISFKEVYLDPQQKHLVSSFMDFARKVGTGKTSPLLPRGATAIFSGPPGTGKTITAEAIAHELGLKFRRLSPSSFLSMWVGETERRIREAFYDAAKEKYLLFIDEAEGLFLERKGAMMSWEKTQVNELLQQLENFTGVLVVATNYSDMMDEAFARRFVFNVKFEYPKVSVRKDLWNTWAKELSLEEHVVDKLSERFALSGGEIRNIGVRAALLGNKDIVELSDMCEDTIRKRTGSKSNNIGFGK